MDVALPGQQSWQRGFPSPAPCPGAMVSRNSNRKFIMHCFFLMLCLSNIAFQNYIYGQHDIIWCGHVNVLEWVGMVSMRAKVL